MVSGWVVRSGDGLSIYGYRLTLVEEVVVMLLKAVDILLVDLWHGLDQRVALDHVDQVTHLGFEYGWQWV